MQEQFLKLFQIRALNILLNTERLLGRLFWELATNQEALVAQHWGLEFPVFKVKYTNAVRLFG